MYDTFKTPVFGENCGRYVDENTPYTIGEIFDALGKENDIYLSQFGVLVGVKIRGKEIHLPVFPTRKEAENFGIGKQTGCQNLVKKIHLTLDGKLPNWKKTQFGFVAVGAQQKVVIQ